LGWQWNGQRYDDDGETAESLDRPALQRLLADIEDGDVHRLVIHRFDRLSRRVRHLTELMQQLRTRNIDLTVVTAPELGTSAADTLTLNILGAFAEFESEMIRERMAESRAVLKAHGRRVAGNVPYGYVADPVTRQLVVETTEAERVCLMFSLAAQGKRPTEIARLANERGWRTKLRRRSGGSAWTARQVLATLSNPTYLGLIHWQQGTSKPGIHEAIIDQQTFDQAAAQIAGRRTRTPGRTPGVGHKF
jgi:DNA invertase Pin-like site-specific DNA recombinase